jgi:non-heme Fe2+,alpha-ketoglutarate-dependent halogenase
MSSIQRDLSFQPTSLSAPQCLSPEQVAFYNQEGCLGPLDLFTPAETASNRRYFDGLLKQVGDEGAYAINCYQTRCAGIYDLCTEPRILDLVEDIVGPNIVCWASHFFCKMPNDVRSVPWHQDASLLGTLARAYRDGVAGHRRYG